jgi:protein O-GlcNAc transferase
MQEIANKLFVEPMIVAAVTLSVLLVILLFFMILQFSKNKKLKRELNETALAAVELLEDMLRGIPLALDSHSKPAFEGNSEKASKILSLLHRRKLVNADLFLKLSVIEYIQGSIQQALSHAETAHELGTVSKDQPTRAIALGNMGIMYYEKGDMERALKNLLDALSICRDNGIKELEAGYLRHIGQVHKRQNNTEMGIDFAMKYFNDALELDRKNENNEGIALDLVQTGSILLDSGNLESSLSNFEEALAIHRENENRLDEAQDLGNIGLIHQIRGDLDSALRYLKKALEIYESTGSKEGQAQSLGNIGLIYQTMGDLDLALEYHIDALEIDREMKNRRGEGLDLGSIGLIHYKKGDLQEALSNLNQARIIFKETGTSEDIETVECTIREIETRM